MLFGQSGLWIKQLSKIAKHVWFSTINCTFGLNMRTLNCIWTNDIIEILRQLGFSLKPSLTAILVNCRKVPENICSLYTGDSQGNSLLGFKEIPRALEPEWNLWNMENMKGVNRHNWAFKKDFWSVGITLTKGQLFELSMLMKGYTWACLMLQFFIDEMGNLVHVATSHIIISLVD